MGNLVSARLGDLVKVFIGGDAPKKYSKEKTDENTVPIFSNGVEQEGLYGYTNSSKVEGDSVTVSARGNVGAAFYRDQPFVPIVRLLALVPNRSLISAKYLFYILKLDSIISTGAAQQQITAPQIKKHRITFFLDISYQNSIVSILSAYDIMVNSIQKRISLLEQMAKNIYKEWFVRFRFPGYNGQEMVATKLGKIPASFTVKCMNEVFEYYIGGGWGNDEASVDYPVEASVIRGADFPGVWRYDVSSCPRRYHKTSNYMSRQLVDGDIVMEISGGTSEQPVGRTVLVTQDMIDRFQDKKVICASFCKLIRLKKTEISPIYFYFWMHYLYDTRIIDRFQLQSTGIINFKFESFLRKGLVMLPPKELMHEFDCQLSPILHEMNNLSKQNEVLVHQRDLLLPRLMSGKLEVKV